MKSHPIVNLPQAISLWPEGQTPFSDDVDGEFPRFTYYLPSEEYRTGASVLICPGGGYNLVSTPKEGHRPAQFLASHGVAAGVVEYRHSPRKHPVPLVDAQRGLRLLRHLAVQEGLASDKVGVMGFSAGGHLAGTLATQADVPEGLVNDDVSDVDFRPDFAALIYPVVSLTADWCHGGSGNRLLGEDADPALAEALSIEKAVTKDSPPMFLFHTQADEAVPVMNSLVLAQALTEKGVSAELHIMPEGKHGVGLAANHPWGRWLLDWLETR